MKKSLITIMLMIVFNLLIGQDTLSTSSVLNFINNTSVEIDGEIVTLKDLIDFSREEQIRLDKVTEDLDSALVIIKEQENVIDSLKFWSINQLYRDSMQTVVWNMCRDNYNSLDKDYNKLKKKKLFKVAFGGGFYTTYSLNSQNLNNGGFKLSFGALIKEKSFTTIDVGLDLRKDLGLFQPGVLFEIKEMIFF